MCVIPTHTMKMVMLVHLFDGLFCASTSEDSFAYFSYFAWSSHHEDGGVGAFLDDLFGASASEDSFAYYR